MICFDSFLHLWLIHSYYPFLHIVNGFAIAVDNESITTIEISRSALLLLQDFRFVKVNDAASIRIDYVVPA